MDIYEFIAWAIDFEGCIVICRSLDVRDGSYKYSPQIRIKGTSKCHLERFRDRICFGHNTSIPAVVVRGNDIWTWQMSTGEIRQHLPKIWPFLILKANQAELVIECCTLIGSKPGRSEENRKNRRNNLPRLEDIYQECRNLNTKTLPIRTPEQEMLRLLRSK